MKANGGGTTKVIKPSSSVSEDGGFLVLGVVGRWLLVVSSVY